MGAKNYKHIAIEDNIAKQFDELKINLKRFKHEPNNTDVMKILLEKNKKTVIQPQDIMKILLDPYQDE